MLGSAPVLTSMCTYPPHTNGPISTRSSFIYILALEWTILGPSCLPYISYDIIAEAFSGSLAFVGLRHVRIRAGSVCLKLPAFLNPKTPTRAELHDSPAPLHYYSSFMTDIMLSWRQKNPLFPSMFSDMSVSLPFEDDLNWWIKAACMPRGRAAGA